MICNCFTIRQKPKDYIHRKRIPCASVWNLRICSADSENNAAATDTKITENFRIIEEKKEFLDFLKKAKKQKEIGLWLITEPAVGSNTKKEELLGAAVSVPDVETVFYALKREQEPEGQLSLFEEVKQTVDETAEITAALQELSSVKGLRIATFDVKRQYDYLDHSGTEQYLTFS